jgi:hypothetical protein
VRLNSFVFSRPHSKQGGAEVSHETPSHRRRLLRSHCRAHVTHPMVPDSGE